MEVIKTAIDGVVIIEPRIFADDRGYFFESFSERDFNTRISHIGNQQQTGIRIISQETLFTATRFKNKSFQIGITLRRIIQSYCPNFIGIKFLYP